MFFFLNFIKLFQLRNFIFLIDSPIFGPSTKKRLFSYLEYSFIKLSIIVFDQKFIIHKSRFIENK